MSGPHRVPERKTYQSSCTLTPALDLPDPSRQHHQTIGHNMSATSFKHSSVYRFTQADHSSSSSSYSPLRRLQHLTTMVSQPNLVLPVRDPERSWDWGANGKGKTPERDAWVDYREYSVSQITHREENFANSPFGQKQAKIQSGSRNMPPVNGSVASEKKTQGIFSGPPSPAFSLDSNSPFANGLLHFESTLFEGEENGEEPGTVLPIGGMLDHHEKTEPVPQSPPRNVNLDTKDAALPSAKVVTRSQSSGQRRRYWDGSEDEWDSDTELFLFEDCPFLHSVASFTPSHTPLRHMCCFFPPCNP